VKNSLINMMNVAPNAAEIHPRTEHIVPLLVAFGAAFSDENNL
jgi:aromatic ring-opening dioxygenase catalytic subunit (LigB family)